MNSGELVAKAYMLCHGCGECLLDASKSVFYCQECSPDFGNGDVLYFCLKCKKDNKHEHPLSKLKGVPGQKTIKDKDNMNEEEKE